MGIGRASDGEGGLTFAFPRQASGRNQPGRGGRSQAGLEPAALLGILDKAKDLHVLYNRKLWILPQKKCCSASTTIEGLMWQITGLPDKPSG